MSRLRNSQAGFTMVELVVATTLGMIVMISAYTLLDRSFIHATEVADREDTLQRGRNAIRLMIQELRSQVCVGSPIAPIAAGTDDSITFYADLTGGTNPAQRTLTYTPATGNITDSFVPGVGTYPLLTFNGTATTRTLLVGATRVPAEPGPGSVPVFRYYTFDNSGPGPDSPLPTPLSDLNRARVSKISISFVSQPRRPNGSTRRSTTFQNEVFVRTSFRTVGATPTGAVRCV